MAVKKFNSLWDALENTRGAAANMKVRAEIMIALQERVKQKTGTRVRKPNSSASPSPGSTTCCAFVSTNSA